MDLRDELERLVTTHSKVDLRVVADDDVLGHELGLDSQALLSLLLDIEDAFGIEIAPQQVSKLVGIRFEDFVTLVDGAVRAARDPHGARS